MTKPPALRSAPPTWTRVLVMFSTIVVIIAVVTTAAWLREARRSFNLDEVSTVDRQRLFDQLQDALPGVYEPTWFQPEIGYTLRPDSEIALWDDTFHSNELGFRTGPVRKRSQTFRILFVGDSWAYGMGIKEEESYPQVLASLANHYAGLERRVEAWTLALPGWSGVSQTAAFDFWFGRLRPNAVVFAPSSNDNDSTPHLLPSGDPFLGTAQAQDGFGAPPLTYRFPLAIDSYQFLQRWGIVFDRLRAAEQKLAYYKIPSLFLYVALWSPEFVHHSVSEVGLTSPYAIVPGPLTLNEWKNSTEAGHGTPAANERYAHLLYRLLEEHLGWQPLPQDLLHSEVANVPLFERPPPESEWKEASLAQRRDNSRRFIPESFQLSQSKVTQWAGSGSHKTGLIGRTTTVLVRPPKGTAALRVRLAKIPSLRAFYPLTAEISIPGPNGGSRTQIVLSEEGPAEVEVEIEVPNALRNGAVLDVQISAPHITALGHSRLAASLTVISVIAP